MSRGKSNLKIKNYSAAIEAFKEAVNINPNNREASKLLAGAYENQGLTDNAIQQYESYVKKFNDDATVAFKLGDLLQWERYKYRHNDAIKYYRAGLSVQNDKQYRYKLARLLAARKETSAEAITEYKKLIKEEPENTQYKKEYRALLVWDESRIQEALPEYKRLADENPDNFELNHEYAKLLARDKGSNGEAVRRYEKLVEKRQSDMRLREEYADVLSSNNIRYGDAKKEYEHILENGGGNRVRKKYADLLSSKPSENTEAKKQYEIVINRDPSDVNARLKYAKLLGAKKQTLPQAVKHYEAVLKYEPRNVEAHTGLAKAYAWIGNKEKAIYHSNLASKYSPNNKEAIELKRELTRGREPFAGVKLSYLYKPGDWTGVNGFLAGAQGRFDPMSNLTVEGTLGYESYRAGDSYQGIINGALIKAGLKCQLKEMNNAELQVGYHSMMRCGDGMEVLLQYLFAIPDFEVKAGFSRDIIYESIMSIGGYDIYFNNKSTFAGAAKTHRFFAGMYKKFFFIEARVDPYFGWVTSEFVNNNDQSGISADIRLNIPLQQSHRAALKYQVSAKRFANNYEDFSKTDTTTPGGYFSPQSYISHNPGIEYHYEDFSLMQLHLSAGPSFYKYSKDIQKRRTGVIITEKKEKEGVGIYFSGEYLRYINNSITLSFACDYDKAGDDYSKFSIHCLIRYLF